jgi:predicted RNase H-like nuclease
MKFLGIDLGWKSQPSGLCYLEFIDGKLQIQDLDRKDSIADILTWIDTCVTPEEPGIIGVDAPTLIPNATGSRLPDKLTHKYFGKYHAGCYPANLSLPFAERTVKFGLELEARGFAHAPTIEPQKPGRYQIEVFPHPAIVHLFGLERILKYKKGRLSDRRLELIKLHHYITEILPSLHPPLCHARCTVLGNPRNALAPLRLCGMSSGHAARMPAARQGLTRSVSAGDTFLPEIPTTGAALKQVEDKLDSLICAYVAAYWWYWGEQRNLVLGDRTTGYIVIPSKSQK